MERRLLNILDFYDSTLIPSIATQPHKFIHRKQMQKMQQKMQMTAQMNQVRKLSEKNTSQQIAVEPSGSDNEETL